MAVKLLTPGRIATELAAPLHRVQYILLTRPYIRPRARAGILRLFDREAVAMVRHELGAIDAKKASHEESEMEIHDECKKRRPARPSQEPREPKVVAT